MSKKKKVIVVCIIVILVLIGVAVGAIFAVNKAIKAAEPKMATTMVYSGEAIQEGQQADVLPSALKGTEYPGDYMKLTVSAASPEINMVNLEENLTYVDYIFYKEGEELCRTGLIAPGQMLPLNLYELLDKGDYTLDLICQPYAIEDKSIAYGSFTMESKVTVN